MQVLNLSLVASDFYSALARILFFGGFSLYAALSFTVSCTVVVAGIVLYFLPDIVVRRGATLTTEAARVYSSPHVYGAVACDVEEEGTYAAGLGYDSKDAAEGLAAGSLAMQGVPLLTEGQLASHEVPAEHKHAGRPRTSGGQAHDRCPGMDGHRAPAVEGFRYDSKEETPPQDASSVLVRLASLEFDSRPAR